jgi:hypothetical protein
MQSSFARFALRNMTSLTCFFTPTAGGIVLISSATMGGLNSFHNLTGCAVDGDFTWNTEGITRADGSSIAVKKDVMECVKNCQHLVILKSGHCTNKDKIEDYKSRLKDALAREAEIEIEEFKTILLLLHKQRMKIDQSNEDYKTSGP